MLDPDLIRRTLDVALGDHDRDPDRRRRDHLDVDTLVGEGAPADVQGHAVDDVHVHAGRAQGAGEGRQRLLEQEVVAFRRVGPVRPGRLDEDDAHGGTLPAQRRAVRLPAPSR